MSIYVPVIFVSILYYAIGYFINKENAKYLLSGYNTMSDEERKKFDPVGYEVVMDLYKHANHLFQECSKNRNLKKEIKRKFIIKLKKDMNLSKT